MRNAGFTLLEMLVVLAVLALVTTLFAPRGERRPSAEASARTVAAAMERARSEAVATNAPTRFLVDSRAYAVDGLKVTLTIAASEAGDGGRGGFRFHPDGSSSGGAVAFDDGGRVVTVAVDWLTGAIDVR